MSRCCARLGFGALVVALGVGMLVTGAGAVDAPQVPVPQAPPAPGAPPVPEAPPVPQAPATPSLPALPGTPQPPVPPAPPEVPSVQPPEVPVAPPAAPNVGDVPGDVACPSGLPVEVPGCDAGAGGGGAAHNEAAGKPVFQAAARDAARVLGAQLGPSGSAGRGTLPRTGPEFPTAVVGAALATAGAALCRRYIRAR